MITVTYLNWYGSKRNVWSYLLEDDDMTLRNKTLMMVGVTLAGLIVILFVTSRVILLRGFSELEQKHVRQSVDRALRALSRELAGIQTIAHDWAAWDDTYAFIADANEDYVKSNLVDETFTDMRLNLMLFIDTSGKAVFAKAFDVKNEVEIPVPRAVQEQLSDRSPLVHHANTDSSLAGIILNPEGPMLIVSEPILTSEEEGPIRGALIMARHLDDSEIEHVAETTQLSLTIYRLDDPQIPSDVQVARSSLSDQTPIALYPLSAQSIAGYALIKDIYGKPIFVLKVDIPREIYQRGEATISYLLLSLAVVGLVFGVVIILLLEKQVLSRVTRLGKTVNTIGLSSDLSMRVSITGKDELSGLANEVNRMLEALRESEESIRRAHDDLERQVEERTADLTIANERLKQQVEKRERAEEEKKKLQSQLQQAKKMEAIGTLARGIAHDFNNLLMGIQGNVSLMKLDVDSLRFYERLKSIEKQVESGAMLTSQLLGYARKGTYELKALDLNQLVKDASETLGRTKKEITIHRELSDDLFAVEADSGQMEQVLLNLFVNAADAMPRGGDLFLKTVNVTHEDISSKFYNPKRGDYVLLRVTDTGTGMDKDTMERVFDPFFTTKEMGRGTGLGLASAYGIIKAHSGYIDVESAKGQGTTFSIYLPRSEKEVQKVVKATEGVIGGTETVLLVDDEAVILEVGQDFLEAMGYRVLVARDGKEGVAVYKKNWDEIDIVVLDIVMPNMGGGEAYDRMREINPDIKVVLSSGFPIDGEAAEILERGCDGFIQKPFKMKQLSQAIREVLGTE
jgi:sensor domain CHASE-containing protein/nitrogen-specific signal transduction histidine kinase/ActR/RegA family two-component response regulator